MNRSSFRYPSFFVGIISLLVVIIVLILASFAVLSYANAKADLVLAQKTAASMTAYYKADMLALEKLESLNGKTRNDAGAMLPNAQITVSGSGTYNISFTEKINETSVLSVSGRFSDSGRGMALIEINKWQSESGKEAADADK